MANDINISLVSKGLPTVNLKVGEESKNIIIEDTTSPILTFIATGEKGDTGATGDAVANNTVTNAKLTENSVSSFNIQENAVGVSELGVNAVQESNILDSAVTVNKINNGSVTTDKLATNSVTADKIAPGAIVKDLLEDNIIDASKILNASVTTDLLQNDVVTNAKIVANAVTGVEIEDNVSLVGTVTVTYLKVGGASPGYVYGPTNDDLYVQSEKDLIFRVDSDQAGNAHSSVFKFINGSNTTLATLNESGIFALTGSIDLTGNFLVSGTVDGRDVSVDGAKLDGIEANATANQTDAEIRSAVENATDSNVFTDADHTKLNAIEASADVTDTANVTAAGALMDSEVTNLAQVKAFSSSDYATAAQGVKADSAQQPPSEGAFANGDKTKLDGIAAGAEVNVNADWNSSSGDSQILNKPTLLQLGTTSTTALAGNTTTISSSQASAITANTAKVDLTTDGAGTIHANNVPTLNQNTTGNAATATALTSGDKTIDGDLQVNGNDIKDNDGTVCITFDSAGNTTIAGTTIGNFSGNIAGVVTGSLIGNSATATSLATARNIGGVSFNGTADINLPGVNASGNQDTSGNAATATALTAGNKTLDGNLTIGANGAGHDFKLYGDTSLATVLWDSTYDFLKFSDLTKIVFGSGVAAADFDSSIQADGSNLVIYNDTGNIQIGDTVEVTGSLTVSGDLSIGNDAEITSVGSMVFRIDSDNNETGQSFTWKDNASDTIATLNEAGEFTMYGSVLADPKIRLEQTDQTSTYGPPVFEFVRNAVNVDNADIGRTDYIARDSGGTLTTYAQIIGGTEESGAGTEGGKLRLLVATHDGEMQAGITVEDGDAEDEIDVTIANGSSSLTTVAGNLTVTNDLTYSGALNGKQREIYFNNFEDKIGTSKVYIPLISALEQSSPAVEEACFLSPCDGRIVSITVRPHIISSSSDCTVTVAISTMGLNNTSTTTSNWTEEESKQHTMQGADDYHAFHYVFDNAKHFESGELVALSIQSDVNIDSGPYTMYWYVSTVVEYDWNNQGLTAHQEYTAAQ